MNKNIDSMRTTESYLFENHINIITGKIGDLKIIYNSLCKPETITFIKNELLYMIPIY